MTKSAIVQSKRTTADKPGTPSARIVAGKGFETPARNQSAAVTKSATVIAALSGKDGATLEDICNATSWQPHSARAFLSGLRKKGHTVTKSRRDDMTCYHIDADKSGGGS